MPITCENAFKQDEIAERTKNLDCVWGCYCQNGYLQNDDGQCVPLAYCNRRQNVEIAPQISNVFAFRHLFRPPYPYNGGCNGPSCGGCNGGGCGGNPGHNIEIYNHNVAGTGGTYISFLLST